MVLIVHRNKGISRSRPHYTFVTSNALSFQYSHNLLLFQYIFLMLTIDHFYSKVSGTTTEISWNHKVFCWPDFHVIAWVLPSAFRKMVQFSTVFNVWPLSVLLVQSKYCIVTLLTVVIFFSPLRTSANFWLTRIQFTRK